MDEVTGAYGPKSTLRKAFPAVHEFSRQIDHEVEAIGKCLSAMEWEGEDTSFARSALLELRWWTNATGDARSSKTNSSR